MAIEEIVMKYSPETGHLIGSLPGKLGSIEDTAPIFVFGSDAGLSPTDLVLYVGCKEDGDEVTGEIVSFELLDFRTRYWAIRQKLSALIDKATPKRAITSDGKVLFNLDDVDLSIIDLDIKSDRDNALFISNLVRHLDDFFFEVMFQHINSETTIRKSVPSI